MAAPDGGLITQTNEQYYTGDDYGSYRYISITDLINNFLMMHVGDGKLIPSVNRNEIIFHAKRAMQEFSYDTLKSIKSQELTIPNSLTLPIPQDYVNYVKVSWTDDLGVKHIIYPTTLTSNPTEIPIQDNKGIPTQDNNGKNVTGTSITENNWSSNDTRKITGVYTSNAASADPYTDAVYKTLYGQRYGENPEITQINGWFTINERLGRFSFSSNLVDKIIILEYISDGVAYTTDMKVPKLAEESFYAYIIHAVISGRSNQPEYIVQRLKKEKRAKLRNTKLRLSNIKLEEISQVFRNKSKIIKH